LGGRINDMSQQMGISTDAVQVFSLAARLGGSSLEAFGVKFSRLQKAMSDAVESGKAGPFAAFGLSVENLKSMAPDEIFERIALQMENASASGQKMAALFDVFGKGATGLISVFKELGAAKEKAFLLSPEDIKNLDAAGDAWETIKAATAGAIGGAIANPGKAYTGLLEKAASMVPGPLNPLIKNLLDRNNRKRNETAEEAASAEAKAQAAMEKELKDAEELNRIKELGLELDKEANGLREKGRVGALSTEQKLLEAKAKELQLAKELQEMGDSDTIATKRLRVDLEKQRLVVQGLMPKEVSESPTPGIKTAAMPAANALGRIGAFTGGSNPAVDLLRKNNATMTDTFRLLTEIRGMLRTL
jgi:hypothetical protein